MDRLRSLLADKTLDIVSLHRRQKRIKQLHDLVTMVEEVKSAEAAVEALVQCQDYTNALNLIESSQTILREHLQGIHGLSALSEKFRGYRGFISTQISQRFISVITSPEWTFQDEDESGYPDKKRQGRLGDETKDNVQQETRRLVDVLFRLDALDDTVKTYLDQLNEEIRVVVKTVVTETIAVSSSSKNSSGSNDLGASSGSESKVSIQLRALTSDEFLQCVQMIFEHLLMVLKRAVIVQGILVKSMQKQIDEATEEEKRLKAAAINEANSHDGTHDAKTIEGTPSDGWSPSESASDEHKTLGDWKKKTRCTKVIRDIDEVVRKICEFSQRSVSNLFAVRKEVRAVYTMPQLRKLYDTTMDFVVSIEKLTGKTDYTLRGALFSQLKLFLEKYHQTQVTKLVSTLDHELWKNTEISETRHRSLDDLSSGRGVALLLSDDREVSGETAPPRKMVSICGKSFRVVWSVLLMLEIVMNYMSCAANFPVLATDVLQRSIEIFRVRYCVRWGE
jgi:vacuolar protein sorting-associated protein 54